MITNTQTQFFSKNWLHSAKWDNAFLFGSLFATFLFSFTYFALSKFTTLEPFQIVLGLHFVFAAVFDLPHLLQTFIRTNVDEIEFQRRPHFYSNAHYLILVMALSIYYFDQWDIFFILIRFYGYWHLLRQDWGFIKAYKAKNFEYDKLGEVFDSYFYYITRIGCIVLAEIYFTHVPLLNGFKVFLPFAIAKISFFTFLTVSSLVYLGYQFWRLGQGIPINLPKVLYLFSVLFTNVLIFFFLPFPATIDFILCTVYHDIQYHAWMYFYGVNSALSNFKKYFSKTFVFSFLLAIPVVYFYN
ncbi:MAG: hypothetical protein OEY33_08140, partial [Bdellovibrionales bacterium]|nr:hypothetical protein [Bdellovibrionales bacterium]